MPLATNIQTRSGNRIIVTLSNLQVGMAQSVRLNDDYAPEPSSGIGDIHVAEWVPTRATHTINVGMMVVVKKALYDLGLVPLNGDDMLLGIVYDIQAFSKDDGSLIRKYTGCSYASGDYDISKHAIVMQNAVFHALDVSGPGQKASDPFPGGS